ncbi:MAG: VWA domain-containing protein [Phycisphaera sp.]|nr:MAG: VWA domain-containing protein [Phycisphaera sp.]
MTFLNPLILAAGLAAIAIPIAIHLLMRRRRKPTPWAAMRFLMEAIRRRRRRLQLERLLLLAVRCLLVAAIALALGRPTLRGLAGNSPFGSSAVTLAIVIDDSIASGAPDGGDTTALDRHKAMAVELLESLRPDRGDRAILIPLSGPLASEADLPAASALAPTSDLGTISQFLEDLAPTSTAADTAGALALVAERLSAAARDDVVGGRWVVAVLADGVAGVFPDASATPGAIAEGDGRGPRVSVLVSDPALSGTGPTSDVGIASLTPVRPVLVVGQGEAVAVSAPARVLVGRSGAGLDTEATIGVRLRFVDDGGPGPWSTAAARLRPGERTASVVLDAQVVGRPRGLAYLEAQIDPDATRDGVPGNDSAVAIVALRRQLSVAIIDTADTLGSPASGLDPDDPAAWLRVALAPDAMGEGDPLADIAATTLDPSVVDVPRLARVDAAFVLAPNDLRAGGWRALAGFARGGGLVAVFPDPASSLAPWADRFTEAFGVPWTIGPEALAHEAPLGVSRAPGDDPLGLLRLIEGELESLLRPVTVSRSLPLATEPGSGSGSLLTLADGSPAALVSRPGGANGDGLVIVFAMPLAASWTDLPARPAIVPLVQELARSGVGLAVGSHPSIAGARPAAPSVAVQLRPGWNVAAGGSIAPVAVGDEGRSLRPLRRAGPWLALDGAGRPVGVVAVAPDHRGAAREAVARERVREGVADALGVELADDDTLSWLDRPGGATEGAVAPTQAMARTEPSLALGAILLGVALALAMLEAVLARVFSHAQVPGAAGVSTSTNTRREAA